MVKRKRIFIIIAIILVCALLAGIITGFVLLNGSGKAVTVTFESNGGSTLASIVVASGGTLPELASPYKNGYRFVSWCYDINLLSAYQAGDKIVSDTLFYASYARDTAQEYASTYLDNCPSDITFKVQSSVELTDENLANHINFTDTYASGTALKVKKTGDFYTIYSETGFPEGCVFGLELVAQDKTKFVEANGADVSQDGMAAYNFSIYKENIMDVTLQNDIVFVDRSDALGIVNATGTVADGADRDIGKIITTLYLSQDYPSLEKGTIINFSQDKLEIGGYYKVIAVVYPVVYGTNTSCMQVDVINPELNEVYSEYELYQKGDVESAILQGDTDEIAQRVADSVMSSEGYAMYLDSVMYGVKNSPSVQPLLATLSDQEQAEFKQLSSSFLFDMITDPPVTFSLVSNKDGMVLDVTIDTGDISFQVGSAKITLQIMVTENVVVTPEGHTKYISETYTYSNKGAYVSNTSQIILKANIIYTGPTDPADADKTEINIDLGKEIEAACANQSLTEYLTAMGYGNLFAEELEYVQICSVPLGSITFTFSGVESIRIALNLNISFGCSAGITSDLTFKSVTHIGITNGHTIFLHDKNGEVIGTEIEPLEKPERYYEPVQSLFTYDILIKGQIGVRVGVEVELSFSAAYLNSVVSVGISVEVGVYGELTGYVRFQGNVYKNPDYTRKNSSVTGGINFETGIYLSCAFTWNCFGYEGSWPFLDMKFPIFSIGTDTLPVDFVKPEENITMDSKSYNLAQSSPNNPSPLTLSWVNITSVKSSESYDKNLDHYDIFMTKVVYEKLAGGGFVQTTQATENIDYVSIKNGVITISQDAPLRLDFTVYVLYNDGTRLFDGKSIVKQIKVTYVDASIKNPDAQHTATFYDQAGNLMQQSILFEGQIPTQPDLWAWTKTNFKYAIDYVNGPWLDKSGGSMKPLTPIMKDELYFLSIGNRTAPVLFYGDLFNAVTGQYRNELIAVVPTEIGSIPVSPEVPMTDVYKFYSWDKALSPVVFDEETNSVSGQIYNAVYTDRYASYCIYYYCNEELVSWQRVREGETPKVPDMSGWVSSDGQWVFSKWYGNVNQPAYSDKIYFGAIVRANTTLFDPGIWKLANGAPLKYVGEYTYDGTKTFIVPDIDCNKPAGATRETVYWQSTEKLDGDYIKLYPGDKSIYYDLTFKPVFEYTVHLLITGDNKQIFKGKAGDVITEDMITLSKARLGYDFVDWGIKLPYTFGSTLDINGLPDLEVVFDANFKQAAGYFTMTFDSNGGQFADGVSEMEATGKDGDSIVFTQTPTKARVGNIDYTFIGWGTRANDTMVLSSLGIYGANVTVYAVYEAVAYYTVTYNAGTGVFNDGKPTKVFEVVSGSALPSLSEIPTKAADYYYTYVFSKWTQSNTNSTVLANVVLTADYTKTDVIYTATCKSGGGHFADGSTTKIIHGKYNESIIVETPTRDDGLVFSGWSPNSMQFTGNKTYTAQYQVAGKLDIIFDASLIRVYDSSSGHICEVNPELSSITYSNGQSRKTYTGAFNDILTLPTSTFATTYSLVIYRNDAWVTITGTTDGSNMYFMADSGADDVADKLSVYDWGNKLVTAAIRNYTGTTSTAVKYTPNTVRYGLATYWQIDNGEILESPTGYEIQFAPYIVIG